MAAAERLPFLDAEPWRVVVVNPTGRYARNQVAGMIAAGTPLLAGVALGRGGETHRRLAGVRPDRGVCRSGRMWRFCTRRPRASVTR